MAPQDDDEMKDIQNQVDHRRINIKKVGVKTITYPITVLDKAQSSQRTIATINMYVNLPHQFKGTHMSRFIEILNRFHGKIDMKRFSSILEEMKLKLDAEAAHLEMTFPFFLQRENGDDILQISKYDCTMLCSLEKSEDVRLDLVIPIAHPFLLDSDDSSGAAVGLWGRVLVSVKYSKFMWLEDLIGVVESAIRVSSRAEQGRTFSDKPIESLLQKLASRFAALSELKWYSITVENVSQGYSLFASTNSESPPSHSMITKTMRKRRRR